MNRNLSLGGVPLRAQLMTPAPPPSLLLAADVDPLTLFFTLMVPLAAPLTAELVQDFASKAGEAGVDRVAFTPRPGEALVYYRSAPSEWTGTIICAAPLVSGLELLFVYCRSAPSEWTGTIVCVPPQRPY